MAGWVAGSRSMGSSVTVLSYRVAVKQVVDAASDRTTDDDTSPTFATSAAAPCARGSASPCEMMAHDGTARSAREVCCAVARGAGGARGGVDSAAHPGLGDPVRAGRQRHGDRREEQQHVLRAAELGVQIWYAATCMRLWTDAATLFGYAAVETARHE